MFSRKYKLFNEEIEGVKIEKNGQCNELKPWVKLNHSIPNKLRISFGVYFGSSNRFMPQHFLNKAQIGAAFK